MNEQIQSTNTSSFTAYPGSLPMELIHTIIHNSISLWERDAAILIQRAFRRHLGDRLEWNRFFSNTDSDESLETVDLSELDNMFGPEYSSDNAGDGPENHNLKAIARAKFYKNVQAKKLALQNEARIPKSQRYEPQSLVSSLFMDKVINHLRTTMTDSMIDKLEGLAALYFALSDCVSQSQFLAIITLYAKTHLDKSVISIITDMSNSLFDMTPQSSDKPEWISLLSSALSDWKLVTNNPAFSKVSRVISMMVTLGIFSEDSTRISLGGLQVFAAGAMKTQVTAVDLIDAVADTIVFFAEGAYQCFTDGSLKPLLFSSSKVMEIEKRYIEMLSQWEYARNGNLKRFLGIDESAFDKSLKELVSDLEALYKGSPAGAERKILADRWQRASAVLTEFESSRVRGGLRKAPFTVKVFGESSVGKSSFTDTIIYSLLKANGYEAGDDFVITLNPDDKHMSNMRSYVTAIKIDDYGNTKLDFVDLAPSDWMIQICNNIKRYAVMADLANKGKVSIEPAVCAITTNVEDLHAHKLSNEPVSIGRRAHIHVDLKVKPEFCKYDELGNLTHMLDPIKVFEKYGDSDDIQDIWLVTVREMQILGNDTGGKRIAPTFEFINKQGMTEVDIFTFLKYAIKESRKHFHVQENLVKHSNGMADRIPWCERCHAPSQLCDCCDDEIEPQFGHRIANVVNSKASQWGHSLRRFQHHSECVVEDFAVEQLIKKLQWFESSPYSRWTNYVPDSLIQHEWVKAYILSCGIDVIKADVARYVRNAFLGYGLISAFLAYNGLYGLAITFFLFSSLWIATTYASITEHAKSAYYSRILEERNVMPKIVKDIRAKHAQYVCGAIAGFAVIWGAVQTIKAIRSTMNTQGSLRPRSIADIKARDAEVNPWSGTSQTNPGVTATVGQDDRMENRITKNLFYFEYENGEKLSFCNSLQIRTGFFLIPKHTVGSSPYRVTIKRAGWTGRAIIDPDRVYHLPNTDLTLVYIPNVAPAKDLLPFFSNDYEMRQVNAGLVYCNEDGSTYTDRFLWRHSADVYNGAEHFRGSYYTLSRPSFGGLCMAVVYSQSIHKHILGFHVGGITNKHDGCANAVTAGELVSAIANLRKLSPAIIDTPQATDIPESILGKNIDAGGDLHRKSPINYIPEDSAVVCYGNVAGRSTFGSSVTSTVISDAVTEVTGVPNKWGAPKFENPIERADGSTDLQKWKPWYESLQYSSNPSIGFPLSHVDRASEDYLSDLYDTFSSNTDYWKSTITPLTEVQAISGIDGMRFIDAMPAGTSIGYPVGGPKRRFLEDIDAVEGTSAPRMFTDEIMNEYHAALNTWASGKCVNSIFGSALKDEPTPLSKDKVRVFQAAPIILQLGIRTYFLPIARFLSFNPLISECAVGINSHGPEWDELARHMNHFGNDRIIAGDYSKYDLRMPAQLTQAAFGVMMQIAKWTGNYSSRDLKIMNSIAYEVTNPLVAFNGDLMRFLGTNPSGQNMTVYINSIVNALLHRLGFFHVYPTQESFGAPGVTLRKELGRDIRFRDIVCLATYGDDAKGSVRSGFNKFNHISFADYLKQNDMVFTMPDKESAPVEFMTDDGADFLKRKNRFDDDLGAIVGMLDENSIFKSLHSVLKSKVATPQEVAAQNIDGALREWFYHGRDVYEHRRTQMKSIASKTGMLCATLDMSYDDKVAEWLEKYR